jgi:IclR family KDG regulon transcriptional repressor
MLNKAPRPSGQVGAVRKALEILCQFDEQTAALTVSEAGRRLNIPKSTAHNLLRTLQAYDFLQQDPADRRYRLGPRLFELSSVFSHHTPLLAAARPHLKRLAERTRETVKLGVLSEGEVLILAAIESPFQLHTRGDEGKRAPLHCTGLGKAILAALSDAQVRAILAPRGLRRFTPQTITDWDRLEKELRQIRARGWAADWEENEAGVVCVAAPVPNPRGGLTASISVSAPGARLARARLAGVAAQVVAAVRAVAAALARSEGRDGRRCFGAQEL